MDNPNDPINNDVMTHDKKLSNSIEWVEEQATDKNKDRPHDSEKLAENGESKYPEKLLEYIYRDYRVHKNKFYFKDRPEKLAFKDQGNKLISGVTDERVCFAMMMLAEARGWKTIKVKGHPDFCRTVWLEACLRDINVQGFIPKEHDLIELESRRERLMRNSIEQGTSMTSTVNKNTYDLSNSAKKKNQEHSKIELKNYEGCVIKHGAAPYENNHNNKESYFVCLQTNRGEKTIWGVDLKRAIEESRVTSGDAVKLSYLGNHPVIVKVVERSVDGKITGEREINTHRNTWSVEKIERCKVVGSVAAAVVADKVKNPVIAKTIMAGIWEKLNQRARVGDVPLIPLYDKQTPSRNQAINKPVAQIEHNLERTR